MKLLTAGLALAIGLAAGAAYGDCGKVPPDLPGNIPEWPKNPVAFKCERGFSELSLCIINRTGVVWLKNTGQDFVAISDGDAIYAITRETHPAHPTIVQRKVVEDPKTHAASITTDACSFGDKAAFETLMKQYKQLDKDITSDAKR